MTLEQEITVALEVTYREWVSDYCYLEYESSLLIFLDDNLSLMVQINIFEDRR